MDQSQAENDRRTVSRESAGSLSAKSSDYAAF
jgi:hypothetical protein